MEVCGCYTLFLLTTGRFAEAVAMGERGVTVNSLAAPAQHLYGRALYAARRYEEAVFRLQQASDPQAIALVYFALGDKDHGFQWLTRAFDERQLFVSFVKFDPAFDSVRSDPRFVALVARLKLPA